MHDRLHTEAALARARHERSQALANLLRRILTGKPNAHAVAGSVSLVTPTTVHIAFRDHEYSVIVARSNVPDALLIWGTPVWITPATETTGTIVQARRLSIVTKIHNAWIIMFGIRRKIMGEPR